MKTLAITRKAGNALHVYDAESHEPLALAIFRRQGDTCFTFQRLFQYANGQRHSGSPSEVLRTGRATVLLDPVTCLTREARIMT